MRLNNYINESKSIEDWITEIKENCSDYISAVIKTAKVPYVLYRGYNKTFGVATKLFPREDRLPKDMSIVIHSILDELFYKKFGWKPRSKGVFATGSRSFAQNYGKPYLFFPSNNFKFIWSNEIQDLWSKIDIHSDGKIHYEYDKKKYGKYLKELISTYKDTNLVSAIKNLNEIMFKCDYYYLTRDLPKIWEVFK